MNNLPPSFTSLYRLVLRATSASVLHKNAARKHIRLLFRPVFDVAARVIVDLQSTQLSRLERAKHKRFLDAFERRMDGTLSLLLNSAQSRGVPHRIIYNMNQLRKSHVIWVRGRYYSGSRNAWNPKAAVADMSKAHAPLRPRDMERMEKNRVHERCWDALGEVIRMAEGRHSLSLGRLYLKPWMLEKR